MNAQLRSLGFILKESGKRGVMGCHLRKDNTLVRGEKDGLPWGEKGGIPAIRRLQ